MKRICPFCGGQIVQAKVRVAVSGCPMGEFDGYRCKKCGEEFLAERSLDLAHDEIVRAGMFGIARQTGLTIPTRHGFWSTSDTRAWTTESRTLENTFYVMFTFSSSRPTLEASLDSSLTNTMRFEDNSSFSFSDALKLEASQNGTVDKRLYQAPVQG